MSINYFYPLALLGKYEPFLLTISRKLVKLWLIWGWSCDILGMMFDLLADNLVWFPPPNMVPQACQQRSLSADLRIIPEYCQVWLQTKIRPKRNLAHLYNREVCSWLKEWGKRQGDSLMGWKACFACRSPDFDHWYSTTRSDPHPQHWARV